MAAALEDTPIRYEDLAEIEKDFEIAETEIIRQQVELTAPIYERRQKMVAQIPNFWPLVLEQAPLDIDQYIQPSDSALLLSSLKSLSVSHFQIPATTPDADPRSFSIRMEFGPNDYFEDEVLEKKFWHRTAKDGWNGLVSEPVPIKWKKGKDLTAGALDLAVASYKAERARDKKATGGNEELTEESKALKKKIESTSVGGISFFAWFGYHGPNVSAGESVEATKLEAERRERSKKGEKTVDEAEVEPEDDPFLDLEIFHDGDELAVAIKEDLWPDAIKYFTKAQEQDALSDADFESDDEPDELENGEAENGEPPAKKRKA